jgi:hypothetical protein
LFLSESEEEPPTPAQVQAARDVLSEPFPFNLPDLNGQLPSPAQVQEAQDAVFHLIRALAWTCPNPKKHSRFLSLMKKAIYRMERGAMIYLFSGKCPVPDERGGFSLDNLPPGFNFADNDSTRVFAKIIDGLPKDCVFPFNIRDIRELCPIDGKKYGFCKVRTNAEAILLVSCLNLVGLLGKWMGAKVFLCNISGSALHHVYNGRKRGTEKFSGIDKSLFEVVSHLSNCVSHRRMAVYDFLTSLFTPRISQTISDQ